MVELTRKGQDKPVYKSETVMEVSRTSAEAAIE